MPGAVAPAPAKVTAAVLSPARAGRGGGALALLRELLVSAVRDLARTRMWESQLGRLVQLALLPMARAPLPSRRPVP